jgi:hypothetical protein
MSYHIFEKGSDLLPAFSKPYADESLSSWLTRLSFDHGLNRSALLKFIGADHKNYLGDWGIDRVLSGPKIKALSSHTNCTRDEILETTLMYYNEKLFQVSAYSGIPSRWTVKNYQETSLLRPDAKTNTLFCPSCFKGKDKPVYYRKHWRLTVSFACTECGCYLMNHCPHCKRGSSGMNAPEITAGTIDEYFLQCNNCRNDISACMPRQAPAHVIRLQSHINYCLAYGRNEAGYNSVEYFRLLYKVVSLLLKKRQRDNLSAFVKDFFAMHNVVDFNPRLYNLNVAQLPLKHQAELFAIATWLLDEWPARFIGLCKKHYLSNADILNWFGETPAWFESEIQKSLDEYRHGKWKKRIHYRDRPQVEFDTTTILCDNRSDYDYDQDEVYYTGKDYDFIKGFTRYPQKRNCCATDLIYYQLGKAEGWY